jgi:hypothetical protein
VELDALAYSRQTAATHLNATFLAAKSDIAVALFIVLPGRDIIFLLPAGYDALAVPIRETLLERF